MTKHNMCYQKVIREVRKGKSIWQVNPFLTEKEKRNLLILSICPKLSKRVHGLIMILRKRK